MSNSDGTERCRLIECQYCDVVHESIEEHEDHVERMHYAEMRRNSDDTDQSPFDAKPLSASEYIGLLESRPELVLRVSDGTGDGTFRFWTESGELYWRCLNWSGSKPCDEVNLRATLDDEDATTQLLIERSLHTGTNQRGQTDE